MIWKLAKILKNSIACLIPFFYTAFVIISLYTSTSCDSGLEESSFFKIQTFLTESYYAVWGLQAYPGVYGKPNFFNSSNFTLYPGWLP